MHLLRDTVSILHEYAMNMHRGMVNLISYLVHSIAVMATERADALLIQLHIQVLPRVCLCQLNQVLNGVLHLHIPTKIQSCHVGGVFTVCHKI